MPRVISFIVLLAIVLLVGAVFFQVMAQFIVPLFLAAVLLVVFQPLHAQILKRFIGHPRLAALATTILILLAVLLPLTWLGWNAYTELAALLPANDVAFADRDDIVDAEHHEKLLSERIQDAALRLRAQFTETTGIEIEQEAITDFARSIPAFVGGWALTGVQTVIRILIGLAIMVLAIYYFLADGPAMISTFMYLSPLDETYEKELLERFGDVSRAVVVATLLSAVVQGALAGLGYVMALPSNAPIFLLTALTMVTAMVPFVGAAAVWVCVCGYIYLYGETVIDGVVKHEGDPKTAIILGLYCTVVVSGIDNVIKPLILHGQSKLHPLLALLSILGGVQVLGPVGILVGPMLVSFLQALLHMLRRELDIFSATTPEELAQLAVGDAVSTPTPISADAEPADGTQPGTAKPAAPAKPQGKSFRPRRKRGR